MHLNAAELDTHLDAVYTLSSYKTFSDAIVFLTHPDASAKRVQMHPMNASRCIRCFILDASERVLISVSDAFKMRFKTRFQAKNFYMGRI